jgi:hypothetical protein
MRMSRNLWISSGNSARSACSSKKSRKIILVGELRYLCSQLVRLVVGGREQWVNLEEIWAAGAMLDSEAAVDAGVSAEISTGDVRYPGRVIAAEPYEYGWRVEMAFSPGNRWSIERWRPEHAFDPETLRG